MPPDCCSSFTLTPHKPPVCQSQGVWGCYGVTPCSDCVGGQAFRHGCLGLCCLCVLLINGLNVPVVVGVGVLFRHGCVRWSDQGLPQHNGCRVAVLDHWIETLMKVTIIMTLWLLSFKLMPHWCGQQPGMILRLSA